MKDWVCSSSFALALALIWGGCEQHSETAPVIETQQNLVFGHQHAKFASVLEVAVDEFGLADYAVLRKHKAGLDGYLQQTAQVPRAQFDQWTRPERMAFLLNVYNASTLKLLAEEPVDSIKDIGGVRSVWKLKNLDFPMVFIFMQNPTCKLPLIP